MTLVVEHCLIEPCIVCGEPVEIEPDNQCAVCTTTSCMKHSVWLDGCYHCYTCAEALIIGGMTND